MANEQARALKKINYEIAKAVGIACDLARECALLELLFLLYKLRASRILSISSNNSSELVKNFSLLTNLHDDAIKYCIALLVKYSSWKIKSNDSEELIPDFRLTEELEKTVRHINKNQELLGFVQLFNFTLHGERDQHCEINIGSSMNDPVRKPLIEYFFRLEDVSNFQKEELLDLPDLLKKIMAQHELHEELFEIALGMNVREFCEGLAHLLALQAHNLKKFGENWNLLPNGNIDATDHENVLKFMFSFVFNLNELRENLSPKFLSYIEQGCLLPEAVNENELEFFHLTRFPFLRRGPIILVSPELVLDSILDSIHYLLVENSETKQHYLKDYSNIFIDEIVEIAEKYGYTEDRRNVDLFEDKNEIGDIDLVLINKNRQYLLIEAKNRSLPLDVRFRSLEATKKRLEYLMKDWDRKTSRRRAHLQSNFSKYDITQEFQYITVSRHPEVISHYSDSLFLSLTEFDDWLRHGKPLMDFSEFYKERYEGSSNALPPELQSILEKEGFSVFKKKD